MNNKLPSIIILLLLTLLISSGASAEFNRTSDVPAPALALIGPAFTYQGSLTDGGSPANGAFDFEFKLFNDASVGTQVGSTVTKGDVVTSEGIFTVELGFGDVFDGTAYWLEIWVRPGASTGSYQQLLPRQPLTAVPYANYALGAPWSGLSGVPAGFADGVDDNETYSAGNQLSLAGTTFNVSEGSSSGLDADLLDGQHGSYYRNASNINSGTLDIDRYSAYAELDDAGYIAWDDFGTQGSQAIVTRLFADSNFVKGNLGYTIYEVNFLCREAGDATVTVASTCNTRVCNVTPTRYYSCSGSCYETVPQTCNNYTLGRLVEYYP